MQCTTDTLEKDKFHKQKRHYKDPDLLKSSRSFTLNDEDYATVLQAVKASGLSRGEFVFMLSQKYLIERALRKKNNL